eukprot:8111620-Alexandrium_andersonii.AAC.1
MPSMPLPLFCRAINRMGLRRLVASSGARPRIQRTNACDTTSAKASSPGPVAQNSYLDPSIPGPAPFNN